MFEERGIGTLGVFSSFSFWQYEEGRNSRAISATRMCLAWEALRPVFPAIWLTIEVVEMECRMKVVKLDSATRGVIYRVDSTPNDVANTSKIYHQDAF